MDWFDFIPDDWQQLMKPDLTELDSRAEVQPRALSATELSPGIIAIIVASGVGGLALIIAFIAILVRCCNKGKLKRPSDFPFNYTKVTNEDPITDDFEVLFADVSAGKNKAPQEPVAILKNMVTEGFESLSQTIISTIANVKAYSWDEPKSVDPNQLMEWAKTETFSPTISNPLLDDGLVLMIARKYEANAFWSKLWEEEVTTVVDFDHGQEVSLWPTGEVIRVDNFEIVSSLEVQTATRIIRNIFIRNVSNGQSRTVSIFGFRESSWTKPYASGFPAAREAFVSYLNVLIEARQRQETPGPILILESPLLPIVAFILFAFDSIASRTMADVHTLLENVPLTLDDQDNPVLMSEQQVNFCCFVILEDLDRSFSPSS